MAMAEVCGVSAVVVEEEGVVEEEKRAPAAVFSARGEEAHLWLEPTMGVVVRAKGPVT